MKRRLLTLLALMVANPSPGFPDSKIFECQRDHAEMTQAYEFFNDRQFLLSSQLLSRLAASGCDHQIQQQARWGLGLALFELGDRDYARKQWTRLSQGVDSGWAQRARLSLRVWGLEVGELKSGELKSGEQEVSPGDLQRLKKWEGRHQSTDFKNQTREPWVAGVLSGILPGAGQAYAGAYQSAAVSLIINALFLSSTLELSRKELPATALASGLVFSVVYVGNIVNAVDSAKRWNQNSWAPLETSLRQKLFPELTIDAQPPNSQ